MDLDVKHDEQAGKYYALIDGRAAVVEYNRVDERTLNFWHTFVPPDLRGRGIADELVRQALDDAYSRGYRVVPSCWFVRVYMQRHPRYQEVPVET